MSDADIARRVLPLLDLTDLSDAGDTDVAAMVRKSISTHGRVAAICVWPRFIAAVRDTLRSLPMTIATVVNFPKGIDDVERAIEDARECLRDGADEIDLVFPYATFLRGDDKPAHEMIRAIRDEMPNALVLKVILETGAYPDDDSLRRAARLALSAGANFLKTSTGKIAVGATPAAARILLEEIRAAGGTAGFKASGGIKTLADAQTYLALADEIMGKDWATSATFRIGASALLDEVLRALETRA
jgi:deoxyribose-phosphate aldolase